MNLTTAPHKSARRTEFFELMNDGPVFVRNGSLYARPPPGVNLLVSFFFFFFFFFFIALKPRVE